MKFCYLDESGTGAEPYAVMAGVVVDSLRMQVTRADWRSLLQILSEVTRKNVKEFHSRDFYSGRGLWRDMDGNDRSAVISEIFAWLKARKHKIVFCAVDKTKYRASAETDQRLRDIGSLWCVLGVHEILSIQKAHQKEGAKGYTVIIFDEELNEKDRITDLVINPPGWTDTYYSKTKSEVQLHKIVDVPYFGDSKKVHLLQVADLVAYILRRYAELIDGCMPERYAGEKVKVAAWVEQITKLSHPSATRYMKSGRCQCAELFFSYAPPSIRSL
jgi:Protein of unknown function (DUF3800)